MPVTSEVVSNIELCGFIVTLLTEVCHNVASPQPLDTDTELPIAEELGSKPKEDQTKCIR